MDEEGRSPTHPELWVDFAREIGARWSPGAPPAPTPPTRALMSTYERLTLGPMGRPAAALGALYVYERQFPEVAAEKSRGLRAELRDPLQGRSRVLPGPHLRGCGPLRRRADDPAARTP